MTEERLRAVFNEIDADCGGTLDMEEIANAFRRACPSHIFHRDPAHCCTGTGLAPAHSCTGTRAHRLLRISESQIRKLLVTHRGTR